MGMEHGKYEKENPKILPKLKQTQLRMHEIPAWKCKCRKLDVTYVQVTGTPEALNGISWACCKLDTYGA